MNYAEKNDSLLQMQDILSLIDKIHLLDTCENRQASQEKLDAWKNTVHENLLDIREKIKEYCKSIEKTTDTRHDDDKSVFMQADSARTVFHNGLITALDIAVRNIKFNFSSEDFLPVIKARGLDPKAFMTSSEIQKIDFPNEALFLPPHVYNGAPLISANILMQPGNRGKITVWAMSVYNSLIAEG